MNSRLQVKIVQTLVSVFISLSLLLGFGAWGRADVGAAPAASPKCGAGGVYNGIQVPTSKQSPTIAKICSAGVLKVASAPAAPWSFQDSNAKTRGPGAEIAAPAMAKALGVRLQIIQTGWDTIVAGLQAGQYQVIIAGLEYTAPRAKLINFDLWSKAGTCYAVKKSSALNTMSDLNSPNVTIGLFSGTAWETLVPKRFPKAKIDSTVQGPGGGYRLVDVLVGRIDATTIDNTVVNAIRANYPSLRVLPSACLSHPDLPDPTGFGLPKDKAFTKFVVAVTTHYKKQMAKMFVKYTSPKWIDVGHE